MNTTNPTRIAYFFLALLLFIPWSRSNRYNVNSSSNKSKKEKCFCFLKCCLISILRISFPPFLHLISSAIRCCRCCRRFSRWKRTCNSLTHTNRALKLQKAVFYIFIYLLFICLFIYTLRSLLVVSDLSVRWKCNPLESFFLHLFLLYRRILFFLLLLVLLLLVNSPFRDVYRRIFRVFCCCCSTTRFAFCI